jgi:hypothetical protein
VYHANHDAGFGPTHPKESMMRFYHHVHSFYCGVELDARTLALCILGMSGVGHGGVSGAWLRDAQSSGW